MVFSVMAVQMVFAGRQDAASVGWLKLASALLLGVAIAVTSFLNVAGATIVPIAAAGEPPAHTVTISTLRVIGTTGATFIILSLVLAISISDRRILLQARKLAENEMQLKSIFDNLTDAILVIDREMRLVHVNRAAIRLAGVPGGTKLLDPIRENVDSFSPEGEFLPIEERPIARAFRGDYVQNYEMGIRPKGSDSMLVTAVSTAPIVDESGAITQIIASFREITDHKRLDASHARLAAIVQSSQDAIIGLDLEGLVTSWNDGAAAMFGYTPEEMAGGPLLRIFPPGSEREHEEILSRVMRGESFTLPDALRRRKDGKEVYVSIQISPIHDAGSRIVGSSRILRNITEKKQLERQLHQSQKMEAIGQLTGGIAHDFNNLLGVIVGNLDLLERAVEGNDAALKRVQIAQRAACRGADLTRRLLAFSSKEDLKPTQLMLEESILNTLGLAGRALGPEIRIATHFGKPAQTVFVDRAGLESALLNLLVNARDAMPNGGTLTIGTQLRTLEANYPPVQTGEVKAGRYVGITVTDTGQGMSRDTLERAFEPFFTTKPRGKGTGLGLAMVYGFVRQSGGTVRLYSELGIGTTVSLYLPLASAGQERAARDAPEHVRARPGGVVLVVDDEPDLLELALAYLEDLGYTALQARDGAGALAQVAGRDDIDLLVTDVIMPGGMNGMELGQRVREASPKTKVILTSGFPADALEERSGEVMNGPLLRKPYLRAEFVAAVRSAMNGNDDSWTDTGSRLAGAGA